MKKFEPYHPAGTVIVKGAGGWQTLGYAVEMVNLDNRHHLEWRKFILDCLKDGRIQFTPWLLESITDHELRQRIIETVCLKQIGGTDDE